MKGGDSYRKTNSEQDTQIFHTSLIMERRYLMSAKKTLLMLLVIGLVGVFVTSSQADRKFTEKSIKGTWGYTVAGTIGGGPATGVGLVTYDGAGECVNSVKMELTTPTGVQVFQITTTEPGGSCVYSVNPDGTGSMLVNFINSAPPALPEPFLTHGLPPFVIDLVIFNAKKEFRFIVSDLGIPGTTPPIPPSSVGDGVAKRQSGSDED